MTAGLQIFDANGNIVLDATYRVLRFAGAVYISGYGGSLPDGRLAQGGFVAFQPDVTCGDGYLSGGVITPRFSISGSTLTWTYAARRNNYDTIQSGFLFYGGS